MYVLFWNTRLKYGFHKQRIESIQKKFLKYALRNLGWKSGYVLPSRLPSYENRLTLLNMNSLAQRREINLVTFVLKLLKAGIDAPNIKNKCDIIGTVEMYDRLSRPTFFIIKQHRINYGKFEPINNY